MVWKPSKAQQDMLDLVSHEMAYVRSGTREWRSMKSLEKRGLVKYYPRQEYSKNGGVMGMSVWGITEKGKPYVAELVVFMEDFEAKQSAGKAHPAPDVQPEFDIGDKVIIRQDAVLDSGMPYHDVEFISRRAARMVGTVQQVEAGRVYVRFPTDEHGNWTILDPDELDLWKPEAAPSTGWKWIDEAIASDPDSPVNLKRELARMRAALEEIKEIAARKQELSDLTSVGLDYLPGDFVQYRVIANIADRVLHGTLEVEALSEPDSVEG